MVCETLSYTCELETDARAFHTNTQLYAAQILIEDLGIAINKLKPTMMPVESFLSKNANGNSPKK